MVQLGVLEVGLRNTKNPSILFCLLLALRLLIFPTKLCNQPRQNLLMANVKALLFLTSSIVTTKLFVSLLDQFYFHRALNWKDWLFTYSIDLSITFALIGALLLLAIMSLVGKRFGLESIWNKPPSRLVYVLSTLLYWLSILLGLLYVFLAYTYFEWGSFIEPHHVQAIHMAEVGPEFESLFWRWRTLVAVIVLLVLYYFAGRMQSWVDSKRWGVIGVCFMGLCLLLPAVASFQLPLTTPKNYAPTVQSPLVLLFQPIADNTDGVNDIERLASLDISDFMPYQQRPVRSKYADLAGAAKDYNIVFYVMESVRRRNVPLYGYERPTMPVFTALAEHSAVFEKAYVMQPRSSKAMSALALGVMPDPRLRPISWTPERIKDKDTVFKRLVSDGRRFYVGTAQPFGGDNLQNFFSATVDDKADVIMSHENLVEDPSISNDDIGLSDHFANWVAKDTTPFAAVLWTECAHIPYVVDNTPFGLDHLIDKYDNCLNQVDRALDRLMQRLEQQGKIDNTLFVIFGDHGEALGEKFDRGHGSYLYEHSMRVPFIIYSPSIFSKQLPVDARFQLKDVPSTILWLLGLPSELNQSENIFAKAPNDPVYMSNVYQDYKLGMVEEELKFIYRPRFDMNFVYDLQNDPEEINNIVSQLTSEQVKQKQDHLLRWYKYQTQYIERNYPK